VGKRIVSASIGALAIGAMALGCGSSASGDAPTKAQFVRQGNAICARAEDERNKSLAAAVRHSQSNAPGGSAPSVDLERLTTDVAVPKIQETIDELGGLDPPAGEEAEIDAILGNLEAAVETSEADPDRFVAGTAFLKANKAATAYGLTACAV
jgi:hypothetical protein